jgi:hypothetical protein
VGGRARRLVGDATVTPSTSQGQLATEGKGEATRFEQCGTGPRIPSKACGYCAQGKLENSHLRLIDPKESRPILALWNNDGSNLDGKVQGTSLGL